MSISQPVDLLSKQERSIILYLESRLVDQAGLFFGRVFTAEDWKHIARLEKGGLFKVHQIPPAIQSKLPGSNYTHWVDFEDTAWILAHELRRVLAKRVRENCQNFKHLRPVGLELAPAPGAGQLLKPAQNDSSSTA